MSTTAPSLPVYTVPAEVEVVVSDFALELHSKSDRLIGTLKRKVLSRPAHPALALEFSLALSNLAPFTLVIKASAGRAWDSSSAISVVDALKETKRRSATLETLRLSTCWAAPSPNPMAGTLADHALAEACVWFGQCWAQAGGLAYPMAAVVNCTSSHHGGELQHSLRLPQTFRHLRDPAEQGAAWEQTTRSLFQQALRRRQPQMDRALKAIELPSRTAPLRLNVAVAEHFDPVELSVHLADTPVTSAELEETRGTQLMTLEFTEDSREEQAFEELTRPFDNSDTAPYDALLALEFVPFLLERWREIHGDQPEVTSVYVHDFLDEWPRDVWDVRQQRWQRGIYEINGGQDRPEIAYGRELQRRLLASPPEAVPLDAVSGTPAIQAGGSNLIPTLLAGFLLCACIVIGLKFL